MYPLGVSGGRLEERGIGFDAREGYDGHGFDTVAGIVARHDELMGEFAGVAALLCRDERLVIAEEVDGVGRGGAGGLAGEALHVSGAELFYRVLRHHRGRLWLAGMGLRSFAYEGRSIDIALVAAALAVMTGAALVASWLPARRAIRIAPVKALRAE